MRKGDFAGSAWRGMPRVRNSPSSATHSASSGPFNSRSYSALRGVNQARSLLSARSTRNSIASGRKPVKVSVVVGIERPRSRVEMTGIVPLPRGLRPQRAGWHSAPCDRPGNIPLMTDLVTDTRVIDAEAPQYNATLVRREEMTDSLSTFWVRFDGEPTPFEAGQYMTIGVMVDGRIVQRPYSVASPPAVAGDEGYEMYVRLVNGGTFTPLLWRLPVGHRMRMIGPKGKFTLLPDDDRTHIFISSGTGNAPFVSMMRSLLREGRPRRTLFLNGVSYARDLGYDSILREWEASGTYPVAFMPTVSRPNDPSDADWTGRTGRVESILGPVHDEMG